MLHVESLTKQWREMVSLLGNTDILSKFHTDVRVHELHYRKVKTFQYHYETILNKGKKSNMTVLSKKLLRLKVM